MATFTPYSESVAPMRLGLDVGLEHVEIDVDGPRLVATHRSPVAPPLDDPPASVREALEHPLDFPALRLALTPDDQVAVVLGEDLPRGPELLAPLLEHLRQAHVAPKAVTLVLAPGDGQPDWVERFVAPSGARVEVHDPTDRKRLSYLATTKKGRRIYLNRTVVDADQVVVLARRAFDPLLGYSGSEGALYPVLGEEATRAEMAERFSMAVPEDKPSPLRREAAEVAWLLGAPFMIQVIEGAGRELTHVLGGPVESGPRGQELLNARWRVTADEPADVVVASLGGDPASHTFADLARAFAAASRVVKPQGKVVLLTRANPNLGKAGDLIRGSGDPEEAMHAVRQQHSLELAPAFQWASAARDTTLYLLSGLPPDTAEELFAVPLDDPRQVRRLLEGGRTVLGINDAHKTMIVPAGG